MKTLKRAACELATIAVLAACTACAGYQVVDPGLIARAPAEPLRAEAGVPVRGARFAEFAVSDVEVLHAQGGSAAMLYIAYALADDRGARAWVYCDKRPSLGIDEETATRTTKHHGTHEHTYESAEWSISLRCQAYSPDAPGEPLIVLDIGGPTGSPTVPRGSAPMDDVTGDLTRAAGASPPLSFWVAGGGPVLNLSTEIEGRGLAVGAALDVGAHSVRFDPALGRDQRFVAAVAVSAWIVMSPDPPLPDPPQAPSPAPRIVQFGGEWSVMSNGTVESRRVTDLEPRSWSSLRSAVSVTGTESKACALRSDGRVQCWGQLEAAGSGDWEGASPIYGVRDVVALAVSASSNMACAATRDGTIFAWSEDHPWPIRWPGAGPVRRVRLIPAGTIVTVLLDGSVRALTWPGAAPPAWPFDGSVTLRDAQDVAVDGDRALVLARDGTVAAWRKGGTAHPIEGLRDVQQIGLGAGGRGCALDTTGAVSCWLADPDGVPVAAPVRVLVGIRQLELQPADPQVRVLGTNGALENGWDADWSPDTFSPSGVNVTVIATGTHLGACPYTFRLVPSVSSTTVLGCACDAMSIAHGASITGTGVYESDSSICVAAVHAGLIPPDGGNVQVRAAPGCARYVGTSAHGQTSFDGNESPASFVFPKIPVSCPR